MSNYDTKIIFIYLSNVLLISDGPCSLQLAQPIPHSNRFRSDMSNSEWGICIESAGGGIAYLKKKHETWRKQKRISFSSRRLFNFSFTHDSPFASNLLIPLFIVQYDPYFNFSSFIIGGMHSGHSLNRHLQYISSHDKSCVQRHTVRKNPICFAKISCKFVPISKGQADSYLLLNNKYQ